MKIELCGEDIFNLKSLLEDSDIQKIAFDKQSLWPFTVQHIIKIAAHEFVECDLQHTHNS